MKLDKHRPAAASRFYTGCALKRGSQLTDDEKVERMLPEAGFLTRVSVSGATLKSLMQQNDSIVSQSPLSTSPTAIDQRALLAFGITKGRPVSKIRSATLKTLSRPLERSTRATPTTSMGCAGHYEDLLHRNNGQIRPSRTKFLATVSKRPRIPGNVSNWGPVHLPCCGIGPRRTPPRKSRASVPQCDQSASATPPTRPVIGSMKVLPRLFESVWDKLGNGVAKAFEEPVHDAASRNPIRSSLLPPGGSARQQRGYFRATLQQLSASYSFYPSELLSDQDVGASFGGCKNPNVNSGTAIPQRPQATFVSYGMRIGFLVSGWTRSLRIRAAEPDQRPNLPPAC